MMKRIMVSLIVSNMFVLGANDCDKRYKTKEEQVVCTKRLTELCINPDIKSLKGWRRVCINGKLHYFTCQDSKPLSIVTVNEACNCLTVGEIKSDNSFYIFKDKK